MAFDLLGADILVLIAKFPKGRGEKVLNHVIPARALENRVHIVVTNRTGTEKGVSFAGMSAVADVAGNTLVRASTRREQIVYADLEVTDARNKHLVIIPGEYEVDHRKDRRPDLYGPICN